MKDKLEVGMYVRTDDDYIFKIEEILEKGKYNDSDNKIVQRFIIDGMYQKNEDYIETDHMYSDWIKKASYNIIDLIEVGDYVNGVEVINIDDEWITMSDMQVPILKSIANGMIKSIITHEQMEQMAYKVGE